MAEANKLQVCSLDVWGNEDDGFEVNNVFRTGIDLLPEMDEAYYYKQIREYFPAIPQFEINWSDESWADVDDKKTGKPLLQIRGDQ